MAGDLWLACAILYGLRSPDCPGEVEGSAGRSHSESGILGAPGVCVRSQLDCEDGVCSLQHWLCLLLLGFWSPRGRPCSLHAAADAAPTTGPADPALVLGAPALWVTSGSSFPVSGMSHEPKSPSLGMLSTATRTTATVNPLTPSPLNGALVPSGSPATSSALSAQAAPSSSFAAALRKLAKQAEEPRGKGARQAVRGGSSGSRGGDSASRPLCTCTLIASLVFPRRALRLEQAALLELQTLGPPAPPPQHLRFASAPRLSCLCPSSAPRAVAGVPGSSEVFLPALWLSQEGGCHGPGEPQEAPEGELLPEWPLAQASTPTSDMAEDVVSLETLAHGLGSRVPGPSCAAREQRVQERCPSLHAGVPAWQRGRLP
ncbi:hypothetical protein P7K49_036887 [Saguinus oedipus]|uniref:Uncharacterized protein n=1 Tax=Saguinus oedipus TaxID=9490 RepID=A0ABQ9TLF2_SAGOE|nr:hypothetical protein P7K49_036887 [Saguinus oedipus]